MEIAAVILAIAYLLLAIRENRWCWPAGVASALLYLGVFYGAGLYMEAWLQLFYAAMGVYGWWAWRPGSEGTAPVTIQRWPLRRHAVALAVIVLFSLASGARRRRRPTWIRSSPGARCSPPGWWRASSSRTGSTGS